MNGIRVPGNPVSTCSGRTGRARRCLDHAWSSPAIAPALQAYRPSMASPTTAPALSAYRPSMASPAIAPALPAYRPSMDGIRMAWVPCVPWPSPAIAPALPAYRPSMASPTTAPALSAYRPSMDIKKTRRAFLPRRVLPPHESISQLHNPNDFLTYATPQRSMKSRCGLRRKSS